MSKCRRFLIILIVAALGALALAEHKFTPAATYEREPRRFRWGPIALKKAEPGSETIQTVRYAGTVGADYTDTKYYTHRRAIVGGKGLNWNPHRCRDANGQSLAALLSPGLYAFYPDASRTGYAILPELAAAMPEDVTAEYAGRMDIRADETGRAWRIALNREARWSLTGEAMSWLAIHGDIDALDFDITADDYIYSLRQLMEPKLNNPNAARFFDGDLALHNARNFRDSGQVTYEPLKTTAEAALEAGLALCLDMDFWNLTDAPDEAGRPAPKYVPIDDETLYRDPDAEEETWYSAKALFDTQLAEGMPYESYQQQYLVITRTAPLTEWADVGVQKVDDYTIDLIFENPVTEAAFRLPYGLREGFLVFEPIYEACKSYYDEEGQPVDTEAEAASIATDYATAAEKIASCGPYAMTRFDAEQGLTLARDDSWYGYRDTLHGGMYQADAVEITFFNDRNAARDAFRRGALDIVALDPSEVSAYSGNANLLFTPDSYTTRLTLCTEYSKLIGRTGNSQILMVDEFREAIAWALDRGQLARLAGGRLTYGLLSSSYVCDPLTGATYRASEPAKQAIHDGVAHNLSRARALMQLAYDRAVAAGIYDGLLPVAITLRLNRDDARSRQVAEAIQSQIKAACVGTTLERNISVKVVYDPHCYQTNYGGDADAIFAAWGGDALDPYSLFYLCYTDAPDGTGQQMEFGYNTGIISLTLNCDGRDITASLRGWARWAGGEAMPELNRALGLFTDYSYETRCAFLAAMETCYLHWNPTIPLCERGSAALFSRRVTPAILHPANPVTGDGGIAFTTFQYDDKSWAEYIQNNPAPNP